MKPNYSGSKSKLNAKKNSHLKRRMVIYEIGISLESFSLYNQIKMHFPNDYYFTESQLTKKIFINGYYSENIKILINELIDTKLLDVGQFYSFGGEVLYCISRGSISDTTI